MATSNGPSLSEWIDDPALLAAPQVRLAMMKLAERLSVAEARESALRTQLDQSQRELAELREWQQSASSERRAHESAAARLIAEGTVERIRSALEAFVVLEPGELGFTEAIDVRLHGDRAWFALAQTGARGLSAALLITTWRAHFDGDATRDEGASLDALIAYWTQLADAQSCPRAALWCATLDLRTHELRALVAGSPSGAIASERATLALSSGSFALAPSQRFTVLNRAALARLGLDSLSLDGAALARVHAMDERALRAALSQSAPNECCAALRVVVPAHVAAASADAPPLPEMSDDDAVLAWAESVAREGHRFGPALSGLAARYAKLSRRITKIGRISDAYQREVRTMNIALEELNADLAEFSGRVAHDLKTPLTAIFGFASMLTEEPFASDAELVRSTSQDIVWSAEKMVEIIDALLLLAKARRGAVAMEPIALASVFEQARLRVEPLASQRGAALRFDDGALSALGHGPWIEAALVNLVTNAIRYGGQPPRVDVRARREDARVLLEVRDNGRGLSESEIGRLFQPFVRLSKDAGGHGLGLTIVRRVSERMSGRVTVRSIVGEGATFTIELPAALDGAGA